MLVKELVFFLFALLLAPPAQAESFFNRDMSLVASSAAQSLHAQHLAQTLRQPTLSINFLTNFIEDLDPNHTLFLQTEVDDLERKYGKTLERSALEGDLQPANEILDLWWERLRERENTIQEFLKEPWDFDLNDSVPIHATGKLQPSDQNEIRSRWRLNLKSELLDEVLNGLDGRELVKVVSQRHKRLLEEARESRGEPLLKIYLDALAHAYDPHCEFLPSSELESLLSDGRTEGCGIGVVIGAKDGFPFVKKIVPESPAAKEGGLGIGDRIVAVGREDEPLKDAVHLKLSRIMVMMRGSRHSKVRLSIIPSHAPNSACRRTIELKRDFLQTREPKAAAWLCTRFDSGRITPGNGGSTQEQRFGCICLPSFFVDLENEEKGGASAEVRHLLQQLKSEGMDGLILDLRGNQGGSLSEAALVASLFIKEGPVAQITNRSGTVETLSARDHFLEYEGPLVVLVNHLSASASEIVAAALQDHGRAVIVGGARTFGKGTIQRLNDLGRKGSPAARLGAKAGAIKVTVQQFNRISGEPIQFQGVVPDVQLPSLQDDDEEGETDLENALPAKQVAALSWTGRKKTDLHLSELRARSAARVRGLPVFERVRENIKQAKSQPHETELSLNKARRLQQLKDWLAKMSFSTRPDEPSASKWQITPVGVLPFDSAHDEPDDTVAHVETDATLHESLCIVEDMAKSMKR